MLLHNLSYLHLFQRHLRVPEIAVMARDDLLELFHRFCVPYGQRKYRDSGRGKLLNKTRHMSPEGASKLNKMDTCQSRKSHSNHNRITPPDLLSGHMKRIKLDLPEKIKDTNSFKRKMSIDAVSTCYSL